MTTWRPLDPDGREPRRLGELLDPIAKRLGGPASGVFAAIFARWEGLVGPDIAAHAKPVALRKGVLVLAVDHPAWATQLRYMTDQLLSRITEETATSAVTEIHLRVNGADGGRAAGGYGRFRPR
jgi:predicted nucleic acid-binding Zn ribbon protein